MLMIVRSFHKHQTVSLIVHSSFDPTAVDPSIQYVSSSYISVLLTYQKRVPLKANETCLVTERQ